MAGVILETVSNKQLIIFTLVLLGIQIVFFIIGGTVAPAPTSAMVHTAHICIQPKEGSRDKWYAPRNCDEIASIAEAEGRHIEAKQIVFAVQFPHNTLDMSRWHQFILGTMQLEISSKSTIHGDRSIVTLDFSLAARDEHESSWKKLGESRQKREHKCRLDLENAYYDCEDMPVFELGSCHYDTYLLNIRLPTETLNQDIGLVTGLTFVEIHQNGGFTKVWFALKTILAPVILLAVVWFKRRINRLSRDPFLFEKPELTGRNFSNKYLHGIATNIMCVIFGLGVSLVILDFPLEWLTLWFDMPYMLIISDIRQGIFYATLLSFWLIFAGEHIMDETKRNSLKAYRKEILAVVIGSLSLLIFDLCERGVQLRNPFHSIWENKNGKNAAMAFLISAAVCACIYFLFFLVMMLRVFWHIGGKRSQFSRLSATRRVAYEGAFYRFKFLLAFTIICAALTIAFFIATNVNEAHWKFGERRTVEISSAFIAGIYGLWNIYVFAVLVLYAPASQVEVYNIELEEDRDEGAIIIDDKQRFISQQVTSETSLIYSIAGKGNLE